MAIPNADEFTAFDLGVLPVDVSQDVFDTGQSWTAWYFFDAPTTGEVGIWGFGDLVGYKPTIFIYTGIPGALSSYPVPNLTFVQNKPVQIPVTAGTRYFLEFRRNGNFATSILRIRAEYFVPTVAPVGSIFTNDDTEGFPAVIVSSATDFLTHRFLYPFPSGEAGDILEGNGRILIADEFADLNLKLYENDLTFITDVLFTWTGSPRIRAVQGGNKWYVGDTGNAFNFASVRTVNAAGTLGGTIFNLGAAGLTGMAANNAETILYYSGRLSSLNSEIRRWDLLTNSAMSDLVPAVGGYVVGDILYLNDDTLVVSYFRTSPRDLFIRRYDVAGATLNTYILGTAFTVTLPRLAYAIDNPLSFWVWTHPSGASFGLSVFKNIVVATGAIAINRTHAEYTAGAYFPAETATPFARFGVPFSCPFMITRASIGAPTTGTIVINKTTNPTGDPTLFTFNAGGGLTPATFQLADGGTQTYNNVPVGIYSIEEVVPAGWSVDYDVSDGSPPNLLSLQAGEVIIINVTNTMTPNERSGIYKITPGKRNDTLWNDLTLGTTTVVKIPNPFVKTGLIGE